MPLKSIKCSNWATIVKELSKIEDVGFSALKARLDKSLPILEREMFGNDHEIVATQLMSFLDFLEENKSFYQIYELGESGFSDSIELEVYRIDRTSLSSLIAMHEKEIARQRSTDGIS